MNNPRSSIEIIYSDDYLTREDYRSAYRDHCRIYPYKARLSFGWIFFAHKDEYLEHLKSRKQSKKG